MNISTTNKPRVLITGVGAAYGGTEMVVSRFIRALSDRFAFDTLYFKEYKQAEFDEGDNNTILIPSRRSAPIKHGRLMRSFFKENANKYIAHWHNANQFSNIDALRLSASHGVPVRVCHYHSSQFLGDGLNRLLSEWHRPRVPKLATCCLAASEDAGAFAYGNAGFCVLPNAFDYGAYAFDQSKRTEIRNELNLGHSHVIGTVGSLTERKNHRYLIGLMPEIMNYVPDVKLLIIGAGELGDSLKSYASELGVEERVIISGPRTDIPDVLSSMDVFAFPSITEGLGVAALEAQANGLPCLVSEGVPKLAAASNSFIQIDLSDYAEWAECLAKLTRDSFIPNPDLMRRYDINKTADLLADIFLGNYGC